MAETAGLPLAVIVGPTGVGKTQVSIIVAESLGAEVISADSRQVYRGMDIGTAKPPAALRARVRHYLLDVVEPDEPYDAFRYRTQAESIVVEIVSRGRLPLLVGGTGLYVRALVDGMFEGPGSDAALRRRLEEEVGMSGAPSLHKRLEQLDPEAARRVHPNDARRIVRALEIIELAAAPVSSLRKQWGRAESPYRLAMVGLRRDPAELRRRIESRVEEMFSQGFADEVKKLAARGYGRNLRSMEAIGYREVLDAMEGNCSLEEAREKTKRATWEFAGRQLTWFRGDRRIKWIDGSPGRADEELAGEVCRALAAGDVVGTRDGRR